MFQAARNIRPCWGLFLSRPWQLHWFCRESQSREIWYGSPSVSSRDGLISVEGVAAPPDWPGVAGQTIGLSGTNSTPPSWLLTLPCLGIRTITPLSILLTESISRRWPECWMECDEWLSPSRQTRNHWPLNPADALEHFSPKGFDYATQITQQLVK